MRLSRFYQAAEFEIGSQIQVGKEVSNHIHRVLRLKIDDEIQLFNGDGSNYQAKIIALGKTVTVEIFKATIAINESPLQIHLGQAISRGERMDFSIQKSVELGVREITPLFSERVQFRFDEKRLKRKMNHWQKIIESACEQSGRCFIPRLHQPMDINQWLTKDNNPGFLFVPNASKRLKDVPSLPSIRLLVGPEGGLTDKEIEIALENDHFSDISLGPRILRTETAALTAISILQAQSGDI